MSQKLAPDRAAIFTDRVRQRLRGEPDWSQQRLARAVHLSEASVSNLLTGKSAISSSRAREIADILGLTIDDLLHESDIYVSAPMTTLRRFGMHSNHKEVDRVLDALQGVGLTPYWPGSGVRSEGDTKDPRITAARNFEVLMGCGSFVLLFLHPVKGPSGALIELGFAMGLTMRVTVFIEQSLNVYGKRPFILDGLRSAAMQIDRLAPVEIIEVAGVDEVLELINANGRRRVA